MRRPLLALSLVALLLAGCGGPGGRRLTAGEYYQEQKAALAAPAGEGEAAEPDDGWSGSAAASRAAAEAADGARRAELEFALSELLARKERLALEHAVAGDQAAFAVSSHERELRHAREDLEHFQGVEVARIVQQDALELAEARDDKAALAAELSELERLYGEPASQAPGAQAMLDRARRDLERARERLGLREARSADLRERELPRRIEDLAAAVDAATIAHESAARLAQADALRRRSEMAQVEREEFQLRERLSAFPGAGRPGGARTAGAP